MENQELLKEIGKLIDTKLENKFELQKDYIDSKFTQLDSKFENKFELQKDYIDSKFTQMDSRIENLRTDIQKDMVEFHLEIIEDIGKLDDKISQTNAIVNAQATTIQTLKLKIGVA